MSAFGEVTAGLTAAAAAVERLGDSLARRLAACNRNHKSADGLTKKPKKKPRDLGTVYVPGSGTTPYLTFINPNGRPTSARVGDPNTRWTDPVTGIEWQLDGEGRPAYPVAKP